MTRTNTTTAYGSVTKTFHWLTALLILAAIPLGMIGEELAHGLDSADSAALARVALVFSLHKTIGVAAFFVALARILWALSQPKPGLLNGDHGTEAFLAELVHWALYGALVIVPLSGWVHHAAQTGFAPIWWPFGQTLPFVPQSGAWAAGAGAVHWLATKVLIAALVLHIAGALKHALIDRDGTLARMLPRGTDQRPSTAQPSHTLPALAAAVIWAGVLGFGAWNAATDAPQTTIPSPRAETAGNWQVQDGTLGLTIRQFGNDVTGQFGTWQAAITFDPAAEGTTAGMVTVDVDIASLSLGTVRDQAMGPDYFDVEQHPSARFEADILREGPGFVADGTLTLKGIAVPLRLPFSLMIDGASAEMTGSARLDRRDFQIGTGMTDPGQLGFDVVITVGLNATRATP